MAIPIIPIVVGTVVIGRKVQKATKVAETICRSWPTLTNVASKSISAIMRVLNRMSVLIGEQRNANAIWQGAKTAIDETIRINPQFVTQIFGNGMSRQSVIDFFAKLFELLL